MMLSIGQLSKRTGVKVPTIRYYEQRGLLPCAGRSSGNQRRYDQDALTTLELIQHSRQLGLPLKDVAALLSLHNKSGAALTQAHVIAERQLGSVRKRIAQLQKLEAELDRIARSCTFRHESEKDTTGCAVLDGFSDHGACETAHEAEPT